jgi:hypothetical protein
MAHMLLQKELLLARVQIPEVSLYMNYNHSNCSENGIDECLPVEKKSKKRDYFY